MRLVGQAKLLPEEGLPIGVAGGDGVVQRQGIALLPCEEPIGAESQVLVEKVGDALGELEGGAVGLVGEVGVGECEARVLGMGAQDSKNAPCHGVGLIGIGFGGGEGRGEEGLNKCVRSGEMEIGAEAALLGDDALEPALHTVAGDDDPFGGERIVGRRGLGKGFGETVEVITDFQGKGHVKQVGNCGPIVKEKPCAGVNKSDLDLWRRWDTVARLCQTNGKYRAWKRW